VLCADEIVYGSTALPALILDRIVKGGEGGAVMGDVVRIQHIGYN